MGGWDDLCESLGLSPAAQWEEVERRLFGHERPRSVRATLPPLTLSENDRPADLPLKVAEAFQAAGFDYPREVELQQYTYRFTLPTGGRFDLYYERSGRPTTFHTISASEQERLQIRNALQLHLARPCPAERGVWNRTQERAMRDALKEVGVHGLWIDHTPLRTQVVLRTTQYAVGAASPDLEKSKRWGMVSIAHDPPQASRVLGKWGEPQMLQRLLDGLIVFGLIGGPEMDTSG